MSVDFAALRKDYSKAELTIESVHREPLAQFSTWLDEALASNVNEPTAMVLSTCSSLGRPSSRVVLLKGVGDEGFIWYTNYLSRKGAELDGNPYASLLFFWPELERQVRIEGTVTKLPQAQSTEYFHSRPFDSQVGSAASPQSQVVPSREFLENLFTLTHVAATKAQHVEKPPHWGGYKLMPTAVEFWQGRPSRMNDRIQYRRADGEWVIERLAP